MKMLKRLPVISATLLSLIAFAPLYGCGGGGGGGTVTNGSISGAAVKGPVNGGTVTAFSLVNGSPGEQLAHATTDPQGNFTLSTGSYSGPVMLQMSGGTYTDEATGTTMAMATGDVMTAAIPAVSSDTPLAGIQMTPLTSFAQAMALNMTGGMTPANIATANAAIGGYFMVNDILKTPPMNPLLDGSGASASQEMINYGMSIAAMSQEAKNLGMSSSSSMVTAMMNDASDGVMNGMMKGTGITMGGMAGGGAMMQNSAGTSGLADAMNTFMLSAMNHSGVNTTQMQTLTTRLDTSSGSLQAAGGTTVSGMVSGTAFNGPLHNGTVTAYAVSNGTMGAQLASAATDANGNFAMPVGSYSGPVMLQVNGGAFEDLATDSTMPMSPGNGMTAVISSMSSGASLAGIEITPLTSMAQAMMQHMSGGMNAANISTANNAIGNYFLVSDILGTKPMNPLQAASGATATQDMRNYGIAIAAMSQYAKTMGMSNSSAMVTAMMNDASDGTMNGMMGNTAISMGGGMMGGTMMHSSAGTSDLATAMNVFMGSTVNHSGLTATDMQSLFNKLMASNGTI